jgi:hypothetical protein
MDAHRAADGFEVPDDPDAAPWAGVAGNVAGAGVAAEAKARRDAAPVRTFLARLLGVHTDERAWRVGAKGEQLVAAQLERLGPSWHVLHSITLSETGTDLDHLVIGPGGVFCINTKNHPNHKVWVAKDTFMVNGQRQTYVRASRSEGRKVSRLLSAACGFEVAARPVIAVVNALDLVVKEQPGDVRVCSRRRVVEWLKAQPAVLGPAEVEAIYSVARRSTTWLSATTSEVVPSPPSAEPSGPPPKDSAPLTGRRSLQSLAAEPPSGTGRVVITYSATEGLRLYGDPRPHQRVVKEAGFRWDGRRVCWCPRRQPAGPRSGRGHGGPVTRARLRGRGQRVILGREQAGWIGLPPGSAQGSFRQQRSWPSVMAVVSVRAKSRR